MRNRIAHCPVPQVGVLLRLVCVYYLSTYYKAVGEGGGNGGHVLETEAGVNVFYYCRTYY